VHGVGLRHRFRLPASSQQAFLLSTLSRRNLPEEQRENEEELEQRNEVSNEPIMLRDAATAERVAFLQ